MSDDERERHFRDYNPFEDEVRRVERLVVADALERRERARTIRKG